MNKLALGAWILGLTVGCSDEPRVEKPGGEESPMLCDPLAQTGCVAGEKCTWIIDVDATQGTPGLGHVGCAPVGATAHGAACADASSTVNGGADTCIAGDLCIFGTCKAICDPQLVEGTGPGACALDHACSVYGGVFESGGTAVAGVCEPTCAPLTQALQVGTVGTAACGSPDPAQPTGTCIASPGFRSFHCAPTEPMLYARTDRKPPLVDARGNAYSNGCAPGFIPFYYEDASGSMKVLCSGMCAPLKVDATIALDPAHKDDNRGDRTAFGKLPNDLAPLRGRSTCDAGVKGSEVSSPRGEDCRFLWFPLANGDPSKAVPSPYNDTLGICFAYEKFVDITVPGTTEKQPEKSCADLPVTTATPDDPYGTARENGCYPLADSITVPKPSVRRPSYRLANGDGPAVRHVFR